MGLKPLTIPTEGLIVLLGQALRLNKKGIAPVIPDILADESANVWSASIDFPRRRVKLQCKSAVDEKGVRKVDAWVISADCLKEGVKLDVLQVVKSGTRLFETVTYQEITSRGRTPEMKEVTFAVEDITPTIKEDGRLFERTK